MWKVIAKGLIRRIRHLFYVMYMGLIRRIRHLLYGKYLKELIDEDIYYSTHALPFFNDEKTLFKTINNETRPCIQGISRYQFQTPVEAKMMAIGVSLPQKCNVTIKQGNNLLARIENPYHGWIDSRFTVKGSEDVVVEGSAKIVVSHPQLLLKKKRPKKIICIVPDCLSRYQFEGKEAASSPNIQDFFKEGVSATQTFSQGDWTLPAFSSMMTGTYPMHHGVYQPHRYESVLPKKLPTMAEVFRQNGFRTFCHSGHLRFAPQYGLAKGFERFIYRQRNIKQFHIQAIHDAILFMETHKSEDCFIFIHLLDTHAPFPPVNYLNNHMTSVHKDFKAYELGKSKGMDNFIEILRDQSQVKLFEVDLAFGSLFDYCKHQNWFDNAVFALTADHGQSFMLSNQKRLSQIRVHIPLFVRAPGLKQIIETRLIEGSIDLMPSLIKLADLEIPDSVEGSPWPFLDTDHKSFALSESLYEKKYNVSIRTQDWTWHYGCSFDPSSRKIQEGKEENMELHSRSGGYEQEGRNYASVNDQQINAFKSRFNQHLEKGNHPPFHPYGIKIPPSFLHSR